MSDNPNRISPDGTSKDWDRLIFVHTLRLANAKTAEEKREAHKLLSAVTRSAKIARPERELPKIRSFRERLADEIRDDAPPLRPDQYFTDEELVERFGTGDPCPSCDRELWNVGTGPQCVCGTEVPIQPALPAPESGDDEPF